MVNYENKRTAKEVHGMCLSTVYKNEVSDANMLARNVADIRVENGQIIFTDLMDNYVIVKG